MERGRHDVLLGSRRPAERTDTGHPVAGLNETAAHAEVLVNATPGTVSLEVLRSIGAPALAGTVLLDAGAGLSDDFTELGRVRDDRPGRAGRPSTVLLSGDDAEAKRTVGGLPGDLGWPESSRLYIGGIATARGQEHFALLFMGIANGLGPHTFNIRGVPARPAT